MSTDSADDRIHWYIAMNCEPSDNTCLTAWNWIHIAALIPSVFSIIASIFIIITGIKYHSILSKMTFGAKLPIFISICDLVWELCHGGDHLHNVITGYVTEDFWCTLVGCMKPFTINCQTAWTIAVSVYLNRSIFNETGQAPKFGKNNIYLHLLCWGIPIIILIIGFILNIYGVEGPWCGIIDPIIDVWMVDIWMIFAILFLIINYGWIMYKLNKVTKLANNAANDRIKKIIKTIGLYPVAYFVQWLFYCLYKTKAIPRTLTTALLVVVTANCGGIFNLFLYGPLLLNQIKRRKNQNIEKMMAKNIENTDNECPSMHCDKISGSVASDKSVTSEQSEIEIR